MSESTQRVDTLIHAGWVIPVNANQDILEDHSVAISGGKISAIMPTAEAKQQLQAQNTYDLSAHAVIPGLINAHGHAAMTLFRGKADDLELMTWLNDHIWPAEAECVCADFVRDGTKLAIAEMLRCGTTTYSDMYFFPDTAAQVAIDANIRAQITFPIMDFPTSWAQNHEEYFSKGLAVYEQFKQAELINIAFGPHAPYTVSDAPIEKIAQLSADMNAMVQMHIHETPHEVAEGIKQFGKRPMQRLADLGLLSSRLQCVHMTQIDDSDIELLKQYGSHTVHCPESNLKLASGFSPVDRLLKSGVNVALGTDGAASNNDLDMIGEMRTAAILAKAVRQDAEALSAYEALKMATLNGAKALGIDDITGSLEPGKAADIAAIRLDELENLPLYNPVSQLVYTASSRQVTHVWVNGKLTLDNRELTTLDIAEVKQLVANWKSRILSTRA